MIECLFFAKGKCGAELCERGKKPRCSKYEPARKYKAFGYCVTVRFQNGETKEYHWSGLTESGARRKGMLKTCASKIENVEPLTEEQYIRAFGVPGMRM